MKYWKIPTYNELIGKYSIKSAKLVESYKKDGKQCLFNAKLKEVEELAEVIRLVSDQIRYFWNDKKEPKLLNDILCELFVLDVTKPQTYHEEDIYYEWRLQNEK